MDAPWIRSARRRVVIATLGFALGFVLAAAAPPALGADPSPAPPNPWSHVDAAGEPVVDLWFGWSSTCPHCARAHAWLADFAPTAPWLQVHSLQVDGDDADASIAVLLGLADLVGEQIGGVPAFLFAGRLETGFDEAATTGRQLEQALATFHASLVAAASPSPSPGPLGSPSASGAPSPSAPAGGGSPADEPPMVTLPGVGTVDATTLSLPLLTLVLGGLDAVNPCALSILLFLVSALVGARSRRRIVLVGGTFVVVSGGIYLLLMAAWLNVFLLFGELRLVTVVAGAAAIVAGIVNVKDFGWFGRGPSLVIPGSARPAIFGRLLDLSETVALPALLGATVLVAAVVSAYEMLCTGGFPVVFTRVLTLADLPVAAYYGYLLLYIGVYILPMLAIVAVFAATLGTRGVTVNEARRLKLLSGLLMLGIGGLLLFAADRLSDLSWTIGLFAVAIGVWLVAVTVDRRRARPTPVAPAATMRPVRESRADQPPAQEVDPR
jgi:hypothetical protein